MTNLEIRAGRTMSEALEHLGDRLGIEEARSFATLIQQSAELGSSITEALRVYSDDMRHKRLSRAEEKAYSLPAKLSVPMMVCIFPVLFVVILLPVFVRLHARQLLTWYIAAWKFCAGTAAGGRGGALRGEPARHRAGGPLRNPLDRRRGASQLAHRPSVTVRCRRGRLRLFGHLHDRQRRRHARDLTRRRLGHGLARCARCWRRRLRIGGACARPRFWTASRPARLPRRLTRHDLEDRFGVDRRLDRRGRRRSGVLARLLNSSTPTRGDERGGHKLIEQPGQEPGGKRIGQSRASPLSDAALAITPTVRGRSGAQCGRFVGGPVRRAGAWTLTRRPPRERIIPLNFSALGRPSRASEILTNPA